MGLSERLRRLELDAGESENPYAQPIPREHMHALSVIEDVRREGLWNPPMPDSELERLMVERGVGAALAHDLTHWRDGDG